MTLRKLFAPLPFLFAACWLLAAQQTARADDRLLREVDSLNAVLRTEKSPAKLIATHRRAAWICHEYSGLLPFDARQRERWHLRRALVLSYRHSLPDSAVRPLLSLMDITAETNNAGLLRFYYRQLRRLRRHKSYYEERTSVWHQSGKLFRMTGEQEPQKRMIDSLRIYIEHNDIDTLGYEYSLAAYPWYEKQNRPQELTYWFLQRIERKKTGDPVELMSMHHGLSEVYLNLKDYDRYAQHLQLAAENAERGHRPFQMAAAWLRIANLHYIGGEYEKALVFHAKSHRLLDSIGRADQRRFKYGFQGRFYDASVVLANMAASAFRLKDYRRMAQHARQSLDLATRWGFLDRKVTAAGMLAKAESHFGASGDGLRLLEKLERNDSVAQSQALRFRLYMSLGYCHLMQARHRFALSYYEKARADFFPAAFDLMRLENREEIERALYVCHRELGRPKQAYESLRAALAWRDSIAASELQAKMQRQLVRNELESKEREIETLTQRQQVAHMRGEKKQLLIWLMLGAALLLFFLGLAVLHRVRRRRQAQQKLLELNAMQIERREELASAYAEIGATLQQVQEQNQALELQQLRLEDSLSYAQRIQNAILPDLDLFRQHTADQFLLFRPADIVSGDQYWWDRMGRHIWLAVIDCPREGVPGAFVGAATFQLIDRLVHRQAEESPADLLAVIDDAYRRRAAGGDAFAPFAMGLLRIDLDSHQVTYAGAGLPLLLQSANRISMIAGAERLLGADDAPSYANWTGKLADGDRVFLATLGVYRQPGGADGRSLGVEEAMRWLEKHAQSNLLRQGDSLHLLLERWKGGAPQPEDWLALGIEWRAAALEERPVGGNFV